MPIRERPPCTLALEDGTVFSGTSFGADGTHSGEVVFNTAMTGYQEILTDPSYCRQIITMTAPHIGNYGVNLEDDESARPQVAGFVVREVAGRYSNHRAAFSLGEYLRRHGIVGIEGIDTRALTRRLRIQGALRGVITTDVHEPARCVALARKAPPMEGADLVSIVAPGDIFEWNQGLDFEAGLSPSSSDAARRAGPHPATPRRIVAIDCGMKRNILRHLVSRTGPVTVVPPTLSAGAILDLRPDGVLVSNGPGDPAAVHATIGTLRGLAGRVPIFGICLGHQLLALALGASSFKLKFGHHGANHPVRHLATGRVEITSQNHGFAIDPATLEKSGAYTTHVNLNDQTLEGFAHREWPLFAVQYHPEAGPGPHDATYLFDCFERMIATGRPPSAEEMAAGQVSMTRTRRAAPAEAAGPPMVIVQANDGNPTKAAATELSAHDAVLKADGDGAAGKGERSTATESKGPAVAAKSTFVPGA